MSEISSNSYEYYTVLHQAKSVQFQLAQGTRGQQNAFLDQVVIANAADLKYVSFACVMTPQGGFVSLKKPKYDDVTNSVYISTNGDLKFSDILNVYYGSQHDGDLNLCDPTSFQYKFQNTSEKYVPDLNATSATINLTHVAGVLPNITVQLRVVLTDIVNVKWSWQLDANGKIPAGYKQPAEVPNDLIDTDVPLATTKLKDFITISNNPF